MDKHHPAGKRNHPATIPILVNDHRAHLSVEQEDWPPGVLENPKGSPLIAASACIRGYLDTSAYLTTELLPRNADLMEALDIYLAERLGDRWWADTDLNRFAPKGAQK